ncbi:hypothetical protein DES53_12076 [Roseimicrobium gellanilyticum]|uniref:Uncharacterized protein n=1 Tax=Roseimicrobium gellanilyticum TaxID=748857 RepID=A0A366H1U3_9BACT|nr:hypothetical protein DES53_12076 [Roseimicrobium gellanilyticum]
MVTILPNFQVEPVVVGRPIHIETFRNNSFDPGFNRVSFDIDGPGQFRSTILHQPAT